MRINRFFLAGAAASLTFVTIISIAQKSIAQDDFSMGFFITSSGPGNGADLGGLAGADAHCQTLAEAVGSGDRNWRAYLSVQAKNGQEAVNARDRIGSGPWRNALGIVIANNVAELHGENNLSKVTALNEKGEIVNGRGDSPNRHDILTGSQLDGTFVPGNGDSTCSNWTSSGDGSALLGHHDRQGGGDNPTSWNSAHASRGCSQINLRSTGGDGLFYCFAAELAPKLDFDGDGSVGVEDIDMLVGAIVAGNSNESFDLSGDGLVNASDLTQWLNDAAIHNGFRQAYLMGDADLNGMVNAADLNSLGINWQQDIPLWSGGDFTADGHVTAGDLNVLGITWQESIPLAAQSVPEPSGIRLLLLAGLLPLASRFKNSSSGRRGFKSSNKTLLCHA
jgi:hypothetical protein